jgi:hypothetical protein
MPLSNAERQARYRDRVKEALRNARSDHAPPPTTATLPPLRLLAEIPNEPEPEIYNEDDEPSPYDEGTDLEQAADDVMGRLCRDPRRGELVNTHLADALITLLEADPAGFIDYARRFVAAKVAAHQPKATKPRKRTLRNAAATSPTYQLWEAGRLPPPDGPAQQG